MPFWGIQVKPAKPFSLKFDHHAIPRTLHISQATLAPGSSKTTSLLQCNVGDKAPVLLCALLPDKIESLPLNLVFDEDDAQVLFSVVGPRPVHLTGFYAAAAAAPDDDNTESYGEDISNSENDQSDDDTYEGSFINDDENLQVLPPSPLSNDGGDVKPRKKKNSRRRLKKKTEVVVTSDEEQISWKQNTGSCLGRVNLLDDKWRKKRSQVIESDDGSSSCKLNTGNSSRNAVYVSDSEDDIPISSLRKEKKAAKSPIRNDDPKRTMPKKKSKVVANKGKTFEADPANHIDEGDEIKQSEEKTTDIAFGQDLIVIDEIDDDPGMNGTVPKNEVKGTSNEEKLFEVDAAEHSNRDNKATKNESKTSDIAVYLDPIVGSEIAVSQDSIVGNEIAVYQDPIVGNEIHVDPGTNKTMPKKKGKGVSNEVKILIAEAAEHSNPDHKAKKSEGKTNDIALSQDPVVTSEINVDPVTNNRRSNLLPSPELSLESGAKPKKKRKERSKEEKIQEENTYNHLKSYQEKNYQPADIGADAMDQDLHGGKETVRGPSDKIETGLSAGSLLPTVVEGSDKPKKKRRKREQEQETPAENDVVPERKADENTSEKAAKKKKQKSRGQKNYENMDVPVLLNGEKENSKNEVQEKIVLSGSSQVRTLSNGLVIEELESSKSGGKEAALGKKLKVQYSARLKENGEVIDSNGNAPCRFRLGDEDVMESWNIGLDGMCVGDKRRLIVPPLLGNGSKGAAKNAPRDSWVIYDVELLSVR